MATSQATTIDGHLIGRARLEPAYSSYRPSDDVYLIESDQPRWGLHIVEHHDSSLRIATITDIATVAELAALVRDRYYASGWADLLTSTGGYDDVHPDLRRWAAATQFERDFNRASVHSRDLAYSGGFGEPLSQGPGRLLPDWKTNAVALIAAQLDDMGHRILESTVTDDDPDTSEDPIGTLTVECYGFEVDANVRVDDAGEIFVRLPYASDDEDLAHIDRLLRPAHDDDGY